MSKWLEQASQEYEIYTVHDLEVMDLNPSRVGLVVRGTSVQAVLAPNRSGVLCLPDSKVIVV